LGLNFIVRYFILCCIVDKRMDNILIKRESQMVYLFGKCKSLGNSFSRKNFYFRYVLNFSSSDSFCVLMLAQKSMFRWTAYWKFPDSSELTKSDTHSSAVGFMKYVDRFTEAIFDVSSELLEIELCMDKIFFKLSPY